LIETLVDALTRLAVDALMKLAVDELVPLGLSAGGDVEIKLQ
jgi:hypothetical protein